MNVALTGIDGRYELEAMWPTETGFVAVDDMLALSDMPPLWSISGKAQQDAIYADTSQQALQEWCEPRVTNGLEAFWQSPERPYGVVAMDHGQWKAGIQASNGQRVAWFTCPTMAREWLSLLPQEGPCCLRDALQTYLHTPLAPHLSGGTWWLPLTAHQLVASLRKERTRLPGADAHKVFWIIESNAADNTPIAAFDSSAMAFAFLAAQVHRQTITLPEVVEGAVALVKGHKEPVEIVKAPLPHHAGPLSTVVVQTGRGKRMEVSLSDLHPSDHYPQKMTA